MLILNTVRPTWKTDIVNFATMKHIIDQIKVSPLQKKRLKTPGLGNQFNRKSASNY